MKFKGLLPGLLALALFGCQLIGDKTVPQELIGLWETTAEQYEGCSFQISKDIIVFSNRNENYLESNRLTGIEKGEQEGITIYHITFENDEGLEYKLSLFYIKKGNRGVLQFKNQENVQWTKKDTSIDSMEYSL